MPNNSPSGNISYRPDEKDGRYCTDDLKEDTFFAIHVLKSYDTNH
jgi:hypothetical protein